MAEEREDHTLMQQVLDAVFEDGVLKPLGSLDLQEHQRVRLTVEPMTAQDLVAAGETLNAWLEVYDGLSPRDVAEVENIALDRSRFMRTHD